MFNLIPVSLLIAAMGGIVFIISNHLSEMNGNGGKDDDFSFDLKAHFVGWINRLPIDSVKSQSLSLTQKSLHRLRLLLLKSDNFLMKLIGKISQHEKSINGNGENKDNIIDFWGDFFRKQQEKQIVIPMAESEIKIDLAVKKNLKIKKPSK